MRRRTPSFWNKFSFAWIFHCPFFVYNCLNRKKNRLLRFDCVTSTPTFKMGFITFPYNFMFIIFKKFIFVSMLQTKIVHFERVTYFTFTTETYKKIILQNFPFFLYSYSWNHLQLLPSPWIVLLCGMVLRGWSASLENLIEMK